MGVAENARKLRDEGKTYKEISEILGCAKSTVSYHLSEGQKDKAKNRVVEHRKDKSHLRKVENFQSKGRISSVSSMQAAKVCNFLDNDSDVRFTFADVLDKFGQKTKCYLTGVEIDLLNPRTYEFDHIVPRSKGGSNTLDNLGIASKEANRAKGNLSLDEFLALCSKITEYNNKS